MSPHCNINKGNNRPNPHQSTMVFLKYSEDVDMMINLLHFHEQAVVCITVKNDRTASKHHNFFNVWANTSIV